MNIRDEARIAAAKQFMNNFTINSTSFTPADFASVVTNDHRTLQQSAFRMMAACIKAWAEHETWDDRNAATVMLCKDIIREFGDDLDHIPFI